MKLNKGKLFIYCAKKGWDFSDLAEALGVARPSVAGYLKRKIRPSILGKIAKILECQPEDLVDLRGE